MGQVEQMESLTLLILSLDLHALKFVKGLQKMKERTEWTSVIKFISRINVSP